LYFDNLIVNSVAEYITVNSSELKPAANIRMPKLRKNLIVKFVHESFNLEQCSKAIKLKKSYQLLLQPICSLFFFFRKQIELKKIRK
jgi:hypothetical protein